MEASCVVERCLTRVQYYRMERTTDRPLLDYRTVQMIALRQTSPIAALVAPIAAQSGEGFLFRSTGVRLRNAHDATAAMLLRTTPVADLQGVRP